MCGAAALAVAVLTWAAPAGAQDIRGVLIEAIRAGGCAMTEAEAEVVLAPLGVSNPEVLAVVEAMVAAGEAVLAKDRGTLTLTPVVCAGGDAAAGGPLSALVAAAGMQGCALTMPEAAAALRGQGTSKAEIAALVDGLVERGEAAREGALVRLDPSLCERGMPGSPAMDVRRRVGAAEWVEARLAAEPGCALGRLRLAGEGVAVGIGPEDLAQALTDLGSRPAQGGAVALSDCPGASPGAALAAGVDEPSLRAAVWMAFGATGCRLDRADAAQVARLREGVAGALGVQARDVAAFTDAVAPRVEEVLDNPGEGYQIDPASGELVSIWCDP